MEQGGAGGHRTPEPQARGSLRLSLATILPAAAVFTAALVYSGAGGHGLTDMLVDPAQSFDFSGRWDAVSHLGVMAWTAAAALAIAAHRDLRLPKALRSWLLCAGLATSILAGDDVLMLHERLGWRVPGGELLVMAVLGWLFAVLVLPGSGVVRRHPARGLVLAAMLLLSASLLSYAAELWLVELLSVSHDVPVVVEEAAKVLGIAACLSAVLGLTDTAHRREQRGSVPEARRTHEEVYPGAGAQPPRSKADLHGRR